MIRFDGKVLLLTGANGAIPRAVARLFHGLGAALVLTDLDAAALADFAAALPAGPRVLTARADVAQAEEIDAAFAMATVELGGVDILVTGAGIYREAPIATMSEGDWRQTLAVNLDGVFHACRRAATELREGGAICNIASMAGHRGSLRHTHYGAAKGAVLAFSRGLAQELAPRGIRVNCVSPGIIATPMVDHLLAQRGDALLAATPLGRLGTPEEVADAVAFLCSDRAAFITGETLHVNGGLHIAG
jgi:3-oxoacyl-[acyl-carrier protein] reductase